VVQLLEPLDQDAAGPSAASVEQRDDFPEADSPLFTFSESTLSVLFFEKRT
jgi:hypothetical protein